MKLRDLEDGILKERKRQTVLTAIACAAALLFGVMVLPVWDPISKYPLHRSAWSIATAVIFLCNAISLIRRTLQHKPELAMHIVLTCAAVLLTLFFGIFFVEGLIGIPPMVPKH